MSEFDKRSLHLRKLVVQALEGGNRGHIGSSMSLIEILRVLYDDILQFKAEQPDWENRDRLILSKGHGCLALYAILVDKGFFPESELTQFCRQNSYLGGHPERGKIPGVEASTGALGHGLSIGIGMALGAKMKNRDNKVIVVMGDGEINEGSVWEAAMCAGKHQLNNLTAIVDYNKIQSYGHTDEVQPLEPLMDKWQAFGFSVDEVDGHDIEELKRVFSNENSIKPHAVICHTVKGKGIPFAENDPTWHHKSNLSQQVISDLYNAVGIR